MGALRYSGPHMLKQAKQQQKQKTNKQTKTKTKNKPKQNKKRWKGVLFAVEPLMYARI